MVHSAFNAVTVIEKLPFKIESIEIWGQKLLVGTTEGSLFVYEVKEKNDNEGRNPYGVSLVDAQKTFSKKPITQLTVIEEHDILLSLSDGTVSVHDLPGFTQRTQLAKSRGCHVYAIEKIKQSYMLCVAIKRKLVIFAWDNKTMEFIETKELAIPDSAKTLVWCGDSICIGFRREYNMINVQTGAMSELFPTGKGATPLATLLPNEQILLGRDNISIFIGFDGKPTRKYGLSWSETPSVVGYFFPYAIAVLSSKVEVRMISGSQTLVQNLPLRTPKFVAVKNSEIYVAAQGHIWKLLPVSVLLQIDQLVADKEYEEALMLCEMMPDSNENADINNLIQKKEKIRSIKILYTYHLFFQGQYDRAMEYFTELEVDPLQVIGLYPNLLPKDLRSKYTYPVEVSDLAGVALDKAYQALTQYLNQIKTHLKSTNSSSKPGNNASLAPNAEEGEDDYTNCTDLFTIMDTTLVKAYIKLNAADFGVLLKKPNSCHVKECEKVLQNYKKFYELVLLYQGKGLHKSALELLTKMGQGAKGNELYGPTETINYLKGLGKKQIDLILEFSKWPLQSSPDEAIQIFTETRTEEDALPCAQVLQHIKPIAPQLVVPFLEHMIKVRKETSPEFHNELIFNYLETILSLKKDPIHHRTTGRIIAGTEAGLLGPTRKKLLAFLNESKCYNPEKMLSRFPMDDLYEERAILLSRIDKHDKALQIYAHKLKDYAAAEAYCSKHYNPDKEEARDVYLALIKVYLKPEDDKLEPMIQPALHLLNRHYQKIDLTKVLDLLPSDTPISKLYNVFEHTLRDNAKSRRNNQVIKNLLKSENLQVKEQMLRARSKVIKITEDRPCPVCSRRLGLSVPACYPNGMVVHMFCMKNLPSNPSPT